MNKIGTALHPNSVITEKNNNQMSNAGILITKSEITINLSLAKDLFFRNGMQ